MLVDNVAFTAASSKPVNDLNSFLWRKSNLSAVMPCANMAFLIISACAAGSCASIISFKSMLVPNVEFNVDTFSAASSNVANVSNVPAIFSKLIPNLAA